MKGDETVSILLKDGYSQLQWMVRELLVKRDRHTAVARHTGAEFWSIYRRAFHPSEHSMAVIPNIQAKLHPQGHITRTWLKMETFLLSQNGDAVKHIWYILVKEYYVVTKDHT